MKNNIIFLAFLLSTASSFAAEIFNLPVSQVAITPIKAGNFEKYAGRWHDIELTFINARKNQPTDIFPEPPFYLRNLKTGKSCQSGDLGGIWTRDTVYLTENDNVLVLGAYSGSSSVWEFYDTKTCKQIALIDKSSGNDSSPQIVQHIQFSNGIPANLKSYFSSLTNTSPKQQKRAFQKDEFIDRSISALINQFSDGIALSYPEFRFVRYGHVFNNTSDDAVAFFSIEGFGGSNYHAEYVAVFAAVDPELINEASASPYRLVAVSKIGGRGWRTFDWKSVQIKPMAISLHGNRWQKNDPACCASTPMQIKFRVGHESISEVK